MVRANIGLHEIRTLVEELKQNYDSTDPKHYVSARTSTLLCRTAL